MMQSLDAVVGYINSLATHQSTILLIDALLLLLPGVLFVMRTPAESNKWNFAFLLGFVWGLMSLYSGWILGWGRAADPATIFLMFIGGATLTAQFRGLRWAWVAAVGTGIWGTGQVWQYLAAEPPVPAQITLLATTFLLSFLAFKFLEDVVQSIATSLLVTRLVLVLILGLVLQGLMLSSGLTLWSYAQAGINNILAKIGAWI